MGFESPVSSVSLPTISLQPSGDTTGVVDRAAWDAAHAQLVVHGGGRLFLHEGIYYGRFYISQANVTLTGAGRFTTVLTLPAQTNAPAQVLTVTGNDVRIEHLGVNGNRNNQSAIGNPALHRQSDGISIYSSYVSVSDCWVYQAQGHGIIVWDEATSAHNGAPNASAAAGPREHFWILANRVEDIGTLGNTRTCIDFATGGTTQAGLIANNQCFGGTYTDFGITMHGGSKCSIIGNFIGGDVSGSPPPPVIAGINIHTSASDVNVVGNVIRGVLIGIQLGASGTPVYRTNVVGNTISDTTGGTASVQGVVIYSVGGTELLIIGNTIQLGGPAARCIEFNGSNVSRCTIQSNFGVTAGSSNTSFLLLRATSAPTTTSVIGNICSPASTFARNIETSSMTGVQIMNAVPPEMIARSVEGLVAENFPRLMATTNGVPASQVVYACRIPVIAGVPVTNILVDVQTAGAGAAPTGIFVFLTDSAFKVIDQTANLGSDARWTTTGIKTCALPNGAYLPPADDVVYACFVKNGAFGGTDMQLGRTVPINTGLGQAVGTGKRLFANQSAVTAPVANGSTQALVDPTVTMVPWFGLS